MNTKRLTILRDALIEHAKWPGNLVFNLDSWATVPSKYGDRAEEAVTGACLGENFCGTSACAMGLATTIPAFRRAGLRLDWQWGYDSGKTIDAAVVYRPHGDAARSLIEFFDLDYNDFDELFMSCSYLVKDRKNPLAVADKITALLHTA